jgi:cysteine sulfinate desulfinase/cysteine desulfurase-like protein
MAKFYPRLPVGMISSHVLLLKAMGMNDDEANACVRISWCHLTPEVDWDAFANRIRALW